MAEQAVLIIHGIGNQKPMQTLRDFVRAVWTGDTAVHGKHGQGGAMWSKPYALSQNFELRRLTTAENRAGIKTDFFEFYWAHLMQGTKVAHVWGWAKSLLWRRPSTVPQSLRLLYFVLWAAALFALAWLGLAAYHKALGQTQPWWLTWLLGLVVAPAVTMLVTDVVGDAARYLHVDPANIQSRHAIRAAGVEVLRSLHAKGYERIVVVGHSLGTVIAYDVLTHAWPELTAGESPSGGALLQTVQELETMAVQGQTDTQAWHAAQRKLFDLRKATGLAWRVSDLITLGSPLAHAQVLMAANAADLKQRLADRELLACPPALESTQVKHQPWQGFSYPAGAAARKLHHAAVFACTRWTNLYFPARALVVGDLVGGPLAPVFGGAIKDVAVKTTAWFGLLSHTLYWQPHGSDTHVNVLRRALDLLDNEGKTIP